MTAKLFIGIAVGACLISSAAARAPAQGQEAVAVIIELKLKNGEVQMRLPGKVGVERPAVLQSLAAGAQVLAFKDASAVILFTDGSRTVTVDERNSPFEIKAAAAKKNDGTSAMGQVVSFLLGKRQPPTYVALATRGGKRPPVLLSPRNTKVMTQTPNLQWMGMDQQTGTVRLYGPEGVIWSAENLALTQLKYPSSATPLKPGIEYSWTLEKRGYPAEKATFKIIAGEEAKSAQERLAALEQTAGTSNITLAIIKASLLIAAELYHEAREILTDSIKSEPDEPTLHFLLGEVYQKTGLKNLAEEEYGEAEFLRKGRAG
jgi:hypothetical protein